MRDYEGNQYGPGLVPPFPCSYKAIPFMLICYCLNSDKFDYF